MLLKSSLTTLGWECGKILLAKKMTWLAWAGGKFSLEEFTLTFTLPAPPKPAPRDTAKQPIVPPSGDV